MGAARSEPPSLGRCAAGKGGRPRCRGVWWHPSIWLVLGVCMWGAQGCDGASAVETKGVYPPYAAAGSALRGEAAVMRCCKANGILVRTRQRQHCVVHNHSTAESVLDCQGLTLRACDSCRAAGGCVCCVGSCW